MRVSVPFCLSRENELGRREKISMPRACVYVLYVCGIPPGTRRGCASKPATKIWTERREGDGDEVREDKSKREEERRAEQHSF